MTSEQRNEIAMEVLDEVLTEATRYAKEIHKKANQLEKEIELNKKRLSAIKNSPAKNKTEIIKKYNSKIDNLETKLWMLDKCDSIQHAGKYAGGEIKSEGKDAAFYNSCDGNYGRNYGRYAYKKPRTDIHNTPGDYKDL